MARILIGEPDGDIEALLVHVVRGLGHEPVISLGADEDEPHEVDLALLETTPTEALELARALRAKRSDLPIIFFSTRPPNTTTDGLDPVAHIVKPAGKNTLRAAIALALGGRAAV